MRHRLYVFILIIAASIITLPVISSVALAQFTDLTGTTNYEFCNNAHSLAWGDFDRDGYDDICISTSNIPHIKLYRRDPELGGFVDVTPTSGLSSSHSGTVVWGDYDNDGFLDLYQVNIGQPNLLFRNDGDGTFSDVTSESGPVGDSGDGYHAAWGDYDFDAV